MIIYTDIDFQPNVKKYLANIDENFLYFKEYDLKHPLAIYNTSFGKIENGLTDFFEIHKLITLDILKEKKDSGQTEKLIKNYKNFLYTLNEHIDDCFHIIKTLIRPLNNFKNTKNQYSFLIENQKKINNVALDNFIKEIDDYKIFINNIVNSLKHDNSVMSSIIFYDEASKELNAGYFVANVINNKYQPVKKIHPKFNNSYTGFSYNRDIRWNMYNIFRISEILINFITQNEIKITKKIQTLKATNKDYDLYYNIKNLSKRFFPDEYKKPIPSITITKDDILKLECPSNLSLKKTLNQVLVIHSGDGVTKEFVVPYI